MEASNYGYSLAKEFEEHVEAVLETLNVAFPDRKWSETPNAEVVALLNFAFDFGIASGPEIRLRCQIRDGFLSYLTEFWGRLALNPKSTLRHLMTTLPAAFAPMSLQNFFRFLIERSDEYAAALGIKGDWRYLGQRGGVGALNVSVRALYVPWPRPPKRAWKQRRFSRDPRREQQLGNIFAKHLGHEHDAAVATIATSTYAKAYDFVVENVGKCMGFLELN